MAPLTPGESVETVEPTTTELGDVDGSLPDKDSGAQMEPVMNYGREYEKALMGKVDRRLLPILGALYAISLIDRVNVCS